MQRIIVFSHGEKGGVGKSMIASALVDYALRKFDPNNVLLVDGDSGIPDVARRYRGYVRGEVAPLNRPDEMAAQDAVSVLFERLAGHDRDIVVINLPAAAGETLDPIAADLIAPAAHELGYRIACTYAVGPGPESIDLAVRSAESGLLSVSDTALAVLNGHLGDVRRFAWSGSDRVPEIAEIELPPLLERVAARVRETPGPLSELARDRGMPVMERMILARWLAGAGFYPDSTDTSEKPHNGGEECLCPRERSTAPSSSVRRLS